MPDLKVFQNYRVRQGFRLKKQDDYFQVTFDSFWVSSIYWSSWDSNEISSSLKPTSTTTKLGLLKSLIRIELFSRPLKTPASSVKTTTLMPPTYLHSQIDPSLLHNGYLFDQAQVRLLSLSLKSSLHILLMDEKVNVNNILRTAIILWTKNYRAKL